MNRLQIVNRARQNCGVMTDLTTTVSQSGEALRFCNWSNEAWMDIQAMNQYWQWLRKSIAFPTVAGKSTYTATQIGITDFGKWSRDSFRNYANPVVSLSIASPCVVSFPANRLANGDTVTLFTTGALPTGLTSGVAYYVVSATTDNFQLSLTVGGVPINTTGTQSGTITMTSNNVTVFAGLKSEVFMEYLEYDAWRDTYGYGALRQIETRPLAITITPDHSLGLGPFPLDGYTVVGDYYSLPTEMSADADIPALPTQFHMLIVYRTMMAYGAYEAASEVYQRGELESEKWTRRLCADRLPEMMVGGALA